MIPSVGESLTAIHADMKYQDWAATLSGQHYRPWLGHEARPTRAIDRKAAIHALFEPLRHHGQPSQSTARRTSLSRAEPQPLDNLARPLAVERCGIHHHDAAIPRPPRHWNNDAVPERKNAPVSRGVNAFRLVLPQRFKAQRRSQRANDAVHRRGDNRNLRATRPGKLRQPRVVM